MSAGASAGGLSLVPAPRSSRQSRRDWEDRVKAWVERSCAEQGVSVKLCDPVALQRIADFLGDAKSVVDLLRRARGALEREAGAACQSVVLLVRGAMSGVGY